MTDNTPLPFALSLSKGEWRAIARSWFDRLTTNGRNADSQFYGSQ